MGIRENLETVNRQIQSVCSRPEAIKLVAAIKAQPQSHVAEVWQSGLRDLGVNYVQEGVVQRSWYPDAVWHFIGRVQSRKVKEIATYDWVQTLERLDHAEDLNRWSLQNGKILNVLVQVNIGQEPQKSGVAVESVGEWAQELPRFLGLKWRGFMALPPALTPVELRRPYFIKMYELYEQYRSPYHLDTLSMGTSDDYWVALEEGASMIRLGTVLLGPRS